MPDAPTYAILGRGRWAQRMRSILEGEGRRVVTIQATRQKNAESEDEYKSRLAASLAAHGVPHCTHVFAHGPHGLGLARGSGDAATWTTLAEAWMAEQKHGVAPRRPGTETA